MADSDIILDGNWTNVVKNLSVKTAEGADPDVRIMPNWAVLHLGGGDGSNSDGDLMLHDESGRAVLHFSATETESFDSDISAVGQSGYFRLGGATTSGYAEFHDGDGDRRIEIVGDDDPRLTMQPAGVEGRVTDLRGDSVTTGRLSSATLYTEDLTAQTGRVRDLELGGGTPHEDVYEAGSLTVWDEQGDDAVTIDGSDGSIRHTGTVSQLSDARAKRGVESLDGALDAVRRLDGVTYEWDHDAAPDLALDDDRHVGFLAQEVREVLPEAVTEDDDGRLGTVDDAFTPLLVEAIKEQQRTIEEQAARLDDQRDRIETLEARLDALERDAESG